MQGNFRIKEAHQIYLSVVSAYLDKAETTLNSLNEADLTLEIALNEIREYIAHGRRQIDQIERRVLEGETIPHDEKVFSIFEEHTEWISKGKAGVPVELGLKVCILEDQYGFILHHRVMEKETDEQVAVTMVKEATKRHEGLRQCSFDKGFHTPANQEDLRSILSQVVLPRKGKLTEALKGQEQTEAFIKARHQHSAVESAINALEVHGLDRCLEKASSATSPCQSYQETSRRLEPFCGSGRNDQASGLKKPNRYRISI